MQIIRSKLHSLIILCFVAFIAWISFLPEGIQEQKKLAVYFFLCLVLILSLLADKFNPKIYLSFRDDLFFWIYFFLLSLNIWFAPDKKSALIFYLDFSLPAMLVYFLFKRESSTGATGLRKILYALCLCAGLVSLFGLVEMITRSNPIYQNLAPIPWYSRYIGVRMMSTLSHPNVLGSYLIVSIPLSYYFYRSSHGLGPRIINLVLLVVITLALLLTFSRGSLLAFLLMLSFWFWIKHKFKWLIYLWLVFLLGALLISLWHLNDQSLTRFSITNFWEDLKFNHRLNNYLVSWNMFRQHPFVGIGLDHFRPLFQQYSSRQLPYEFQVPESIYLMHLAEGGLFGFLGLVLLIGDALKKGWQKYCKSNAIDRAMLLAILLGFIGFLLNMSTYDGLLWKTPFYLFWIFLAIIR